MKTKVLVLLGFCLIIGILVSYPKRQAPPPEPGSIRPINSNLKVALKKDSSGNITESTEFGDDGILKRKTTYNGARPDKSQTFDASGKLKSQDSFSYDASGKLTAVFRTTANGEVMQMVYSYDESGKETGRRLIDFSGREVPLEKQKEVWGD